MDNQGLHIACTLMIRTHQPSGPTYIECNGSILFANFHILHISPKVMTKIYYYCINATQNKTPIFNSLFY